jgi:Cu2+-containing amine oxidase
LVVRDGVEVDGAENTVIEVDTVGIPQGKEPPASLAGSLVATV